VYGRIRGQTGAGAVPDWIPAEALGPSGGQLFTRVSRRPLTEGISGFFTAAGYREVLLHNLATTAHDVAGESWVLGHAQQIPTDGPLVVGLEQAVVGLYFADAQKRWDALLADLALAAPGNREAMVQQLYVLSSPQSPMRDLLTAIAGVLRFDGTPAASDGKPGQDAKKPQVAALISPSTAEAAPAPSLAPRTFEAHYQPLLDLVGGGRPAPIDHVLRLVNALQQELAAAAPGAIAVPATLQGSGDPVQLLLAEADRQPAPVSRWLRQIANDGNVMLGSAAQAAALAAFNASDGPKGLCHTVVDGHYPFDPASHQDTPIDDFTRLFMPGGMLDSYYQAQIKPYVDTRGAVWRAAWRRRWTPRPSRASSVPPRSAMTSSRSGADSRRSGSP
jgi:type VI secretion system protein ImpL